MHNIAYLLGNASITNGMATVTVNGLECGVTYTIIAGGRYDNLSFVGPRSSYENMTTSLCVGERDDAGTYKI